MSVVARASPEGAIESHVVRSSGIQEINERIAEDSILKGATRNECGSVKSDTTAVRL